MRDVLVDVNINFKVTVHVGTDQNIETEIFCRL